MLKCENLNENNFIVGKWELNWIESGFFPDKNLLFERMPEDKDLDQDIFEFKKDGTILHQSNYQLSECPVGTFTIKDGNWKYQDNILTLELRGLKIADYWYWWIIKYKVMRQEDKMWLIVDGIIKNKQSSTASISSWEEFLHEK